MATLIAGAAPSSFLVTNNCTLNITPGTSGSVLFWCNPGLGGTAQGQTLTYGPASISVSAGSTVFLQANGTDATYSGLVTGTGTSVATATAVYNASSVDLTFYVAQRPVTVASIIGRVTVAGTDAGSVTAVVRKVPSGTAIGSGTALHSSTYNLKGTANTNQSLTLSTTASDLLLAAGDSLAVDFTGTLTAATGVVTVGILPTL